ncbi:MAG TPA: heterodisulfide reductase-related iron-sulfur binding cluster [Tepidisphaeraceae bacterium]|jgi:glycolate oxidase iron-sulfur subunit
MGEKAIHLDQRTYSRGLSCVHCGLCLPACPTYVATGYEGDSPRGRIQLMLGLADGRIEATDTVRRHLDLCLDCRGCETACPSGVVYHELLEESRAQLDKTRPPQNRFIRWMFFHVLTKPFRLKMALLPPRILQKLGMYNFLVRKSGLVHALPAGMQKMESMLPPGKIWPRALPRRTPAKGGTRNVKLGQDEGTRRVIFFPGCVGSVFGEDLNRQAVELLSACGAEVIIPRGQTCCGAIHMHNGADGPAQKMARQNIDAMLPINGPKVDYMCSTIAGCGAMLREYDFVLREDKKYAWRAQEFVKRMRDISEVLLDLGLPAMKYRVEQTVTYHDACHLAHAQKVVAAPRRLLAQIPGLKIVPLPESDLCCGAAGTYNLTEPAMAAKLAQRKIANVRSTKASICVAGNIGCQMHLQANAGASIRFVHPVTLLHQAVFGPAPGAA